MIIIQKSPPEIKRLYDSYYAYESPEIVQKKVQHQYQYDCFELYRSLNAGSHTGNIFQHINIGFDLPCSLVASSNTKKVIVNKSFKVEIHLYRLRTQDKSKTEDILVEPYFPGFQTSLIDIYGILKERPGLKTSDSYRYSTTHTLRIMRHIPRRFHAVLPQFFIDKDILLFDSFEAFYEAIHQLNESQLRTLFGAQIHFVKLV